MKVTYHAFEFTKVALLNYPVTPEPIEFYRKCLVKKRNNAKFSCKATIKYYFRHIQYREKMQNIIKSANKAKQYVFLCSLIYFFPN